MRRLAFLLVLGCAGKKPVPPDARPPDAAPLPAERADGPTRALCEQAADHLQKIAVASLPADAPEEERAYVAHFAQENRQSVIAFCLETSVPEEAACVAAAPDFPTLAGCERFRRQVPADLADRGAVDEHDCELLFRRLRQFEIEAGTPPAQIDDTRDQVIRNCEEHAKPGTVACFIASRTYARARACP